MAFVVVQVLPAWSVAVADGVQTMLLPGPCVPTAPDAVPRVMSGPDDGLWRGQIRPTAQALSYAARSASVCPRGSVARSHR